ncbi:MAG: hypothetical protein WEE20_06030 [Bacteroidota bacterium]
MSANTKNTKKEAKKKNGVVKDIDKVTQIHIVRDFDITDITKPSELLLDVVKSLKTKKERSIALHVLNNP